MGEETPFKTSAINLLLTAALLLFLLDILQPLLIPLLYGMFIALILYPFCNKLESIGVGRNLSILIVMLMLLLLFSGLITVILYQYELFMNDLPLVKEKLGPFVKAAVTWLEMQLGVKANPDADLLKSIVRYSGINMGAFFSSGINLVGSALFNLVMVPLYAALMLGFRGNLKTVMLLLGGVANKERLQHIIIGSVKIYGKYIKGMALVYLIVGVLNSIGLLLLGIKYAVLFGMLTAIMTIIPYFGIIISSLLPISMAWLTTNSILYPFGVILVFSVVQYLEANFIYPYVVGKRVNINILVSIVSVVAGGILWGVSGMVLFLPLIAILKIISDELPEWKTLSMLLGDHRSPHRSKET